MTNVSKLKRIGSATAMAFLVGLFTMGLFFVVALIMNWVITGSIEFRSNSLLEITQRTSFVFGVLFGIIGFIIEYKESELK